MREVPLAPEGGSITVGESSGVLVEIRPWTLAEADHYRQTGETPLAHLHRENLAAMWGGENPWP